MTNHWHECPMCGDVELMEGPAPADCGPVETEPTGPDQADARWWAQASQEAPAAEEARSYQPTAGGRATGLTDHDMAYWPR